MRDEPHAETQHRARPVPPPHVTDTIGDAPPPSSEQLLFSIIEELRVLVVAGVAYGVLVAGVGSRFAMFLIRATSPESVIGLESDDGFRIGEFTVGGTYNLLALGAAVGVIGAGTYRLVQPWLLGPSWFRRLTTGAAAGVVAGSMLVHADGIDFRLLKPTWLAIGLFVALPALFGTFIGSVVDRVASPTSWTRRGRFRWTLPTASLVAFPPTIFIVPFAATIATVLLVLRSVEPVQKLRSTTGYGVAVRAIWLGIAALGLFVLIEDVVDISRVV